MTRSALKGLHGQGSVREWYANKTGQNSNCPPHHFLVMPIKGSCDFLLPQITTSASMGSVAPTSIPILPQRFLHFHLDGWLNGFGPADNGEGFLLLLATSL